MTHIPSSGLSGLVAQAHRSSVFDQLSKHSAFATYHATSHPSRGFAQTAKRPRDDSGSEYGPLTRWTDAADGLRRSVDPRPARRRRPRLGSRRFPSHVIDTPQTASYRDAPESHFFETAETGSS